MRVLVTQHIHDVEVPYTKQFVVQSHRATVREAFIEYHKIEEGDKWQPDRWTIINEHGLFVTCPVCAESWIQISDHPHPRRMTGDDCFRLRKQMNMSRRELAKIAGVHPVTIMRFEKVATHKLFDAVYDKIATVLNFK